MIMGTTLTAVVVVTEIVWIVVVGICHVEKLNAAK
tara:strand:+ start:576 stop:680 length:105 start_codon:yes stop_codon:yes gene_type:complete